MSNSGADTIRILVATDNHVGYNERDPVRGDDSWKTFDEILRIAKDRDVDMVLLAGDLFHENKPSRKAMYQVMRSLRQNCFGDKPCELEMLSDTSEHFAGAFNHVNYEDENLNVSIPVFSIHGNHDDPSGEGNFAALDILQASGLLNYYGRTPEADNVKVRPLCLQKGGTKLALYGISNVRDERLFRTFRDGGVTFFRSGSQAEDFFNILSIHQNHHAYTETGFIPEKFLPSDMDLVVWGHEHECIIDPKLNIEKNFHVMQPGSSVATSLDRGEAVPKHVALVTVNGTDFSSEAIRLKTVRPFVWKEVVLRNEDEMVEIAHHNDNRTKITQFLTAKVDELIQEAEQSWHDVRGDVDDEMDEDEDRMLPIVRLRVDTTAPPEGGEFQVDNPQRFSNRFVNRVANINDVVQYHRKRTGVRTTKNQPDMPEESVMAQITLDSVKVEKLVQEFLTAQALSILPQNSFSNAVGQYVDKDDKHALEDFLKDSLESQVDNLLGGGDDNEIDKDEMFEAIETRKAQMEEAYAKGERKRIARRAANRKPKPKNWDSDEDGPWEESIASVYGPEDESQQKDDDEADDASVASPTRATRGRGSRGGRGGKAASGASTRKAPATKKVPPKSSATKARRRQPFESDDEEGDGDKDVIMIDDDEDDDDNGVEAEESQGLFVSQASKPSQRSKTTRPARGTVRGRGAPASSNTAGARQTQISFGSQITNGSSRTVGRTTASKRIQEPSDDEISDDDAFEPPPPNQRAVRSTRR